MHVTTFNPPAAPRPVTLVRGQLVDGYIKGATVFADANNNGVLDAGEQTATTGANGEFFFASDAQGPIVAIGGIDTATKVAFTGTLTAPQGSTSVTALSTLVQRIAATNGGNVGAAMARVNQALGLPADAAITTIDPVAATLGVSSTAATAFLANANLFGSVALASAAGATGDLFGKLATAIAAGTGTFDPTSVATMTTLGLSGQVATDTAAIATSEKLLLATKLAAHPNDPTGLVADVYAVETAVQAQAAPALKTAAANGTTSSVAGTYTGNNLTAIAGAAADTASGNPPTISYTDTVTNTVGYARSDTYSGPVDYLQKQYIWASDNAVALSAAAPNSFIKGGASGDALVVTGGKNVLDGAGGSNYLIGADGSDGGYDTFFVDARGGVETWSTIINFHHGRPGHHLRLPPRPQHPPLHRERRGRRRQGPHHPFRDQRRRHRHPRQHDLHRPHPGRRRRPFQHHHRHPPAQHRRRHRLHAHPIQPVAGPHTARRRTNAIANPAQNTTRLAGSGTDRAASGSA